MTDETVSQSIPPAPGGGRDSSARQRAGRPALQAVSLVGFMGAGKTTVGRALAARLGWRFADLDDLIQAREGRSIAEIFEQQGEAAFRDLERLVVREILASAESAPLVLALGGGAFLVDEVHQTLRQAEIPAVFLDASVEELFRRSEQPDVVRPLRRESEPFRQLYERRRPAYLKAELHIETGGKPIAVVVEEIISELNLVPTSASGPGSGVCE
jgi:shikimate kinase